MASYFSGETGDSVNFQKEISNMMHGFGDNPNPNPATVVFIESIVLQQLRSVLQEALNICEIRGTKIISNYEIIYLMRKNPYKLKHLIDYQKSLEELALAKAHKHSEKLEEDGITFSDAEAVEDDVADQARGSTVKHKRNHADIISDLDEIGTVKHLRGATVAQVRKMRAAKLSEKLPYEKYVIYHKARCASFRSGSSFVNGFSKLEQWVNPNKELTINSLAMEVLGFIAYETIAEIMDGVHLIRQDAKKKPGDPFSKFDGGFFCSPEALQNAVYVKSGYEGFPAISVAEVREVLRRIYLQLGGLNGLFARNMNQDVPVRFIAF